MSVNTSNTSKTSRGMSGPRMGEHVVAVRFAAWRPQEVIVRAYSSGGRSGAPYIVVGVGTCLTYAHDQAAVDSHVTAWQDAERVNRSVRLPEFAPTSAYRRHTGEDLSVICNVTGEQRHSVTSSTGPDGRPVLTVTVGAVAVDVHTTTALGSYLAAWQETHLGDAVVPAVSPLVPPAVVRQQSQRLVGPGQLQTPLRGGTDRRIECLSSLTR